MVAGQASWRSATASAAHSGPPSSAPTGAAIRTSAAGAARGSAVRAAAPGTSSLRVELRAAADARLRRVAQSGAAVSGQTKTSAQLACVPRGRRRGKGPPQARLQPRKAARGVPVGVATSAGTVSTAWSTRECPSRPTPSACGSLVGIKKTARVDIASPRKPTFSRSFPVMAARLTTRPPRRGRYRELR
jgi:hypothetical protein